MAGFFTKKRSVIIGIVFLALAGGAFAVQPMLESRILKEFDEALAKLPGTVSVQKKEAGLLSRSLTITGFSYETPNKLWSISFAKGSVSGVDMQALVMPGVRKVADSLQLEDVTLTQVLSEKAAPVISHYDTLAITDITTDIQALGRLEDFDADQPDALEKFQVLLKELRPVFEQSRIGSVSAKNYNTKVADPFFGLNMTLNDFSVHDIGFLAAGKLEASGLSGELGPMMKIGFDRFSINGYALPDFYTLLSEKLEPEMADMMALLGKTPLRVDGLSLTNFSCSAPLMSKEPFTVKQVDLTFLVSDTNGKVQGEIKEAFVPAEMVALANLVPHYKKLYGKALLISKGIDFDYSLDAAKTNLRVNCRDMHIEEPALGNAKVAFDLSLPAGMIDASYGSANGEPLIYSLTMKLEDKEFISLLARSQAAMFGEASGPEFESMVAEMRKSFAESIVASSETDAASIKEMRENMRKLLQDSGVFEMSFAPATPVSIELSEKTEGWKSVYTPPVK